MSGATTVGKNDMIQNSEEKTWFAACMPAIANAFCIRPTHICASR
jgi:hypothetical protein